MFFWTSEPQGQLVISKAVTEGVNIEGVFDAVRAANAYSQDDAFCAARIPVKVEIFGGKVHDKFGVIDAFGSDPTVILGSYNWTEAGAFDNDENTLIIHSPDIAGLYYNEANTLYSVLPSVTVCGHPSAESGLAACRDDIDNDFDNLVDLADPNCAESTLLTYTDGVDNDGDGDIDRADLDCFMLRSGYLPIMLNP